MISAAAFAGSPGAAAATIGPRLDVILKAFAGGDDAAHANTVIAALKTSPQLVDQLNGLAASGLLKGLEIAVGQPGRSLASHQDGVIRLTPQFVDGQMPAGGGDAAHRQDMAQRNIVFILGYMAAKLRSAQDVAADDAKRAADLKAQIAATPKGQPFNADAFLKGGLQSNIRNEARAYLEGYNDEIDAAMAAKGGRLNPPEAFQLLKEGRNTRPVLEAAMLPQPDRLVPVGTLQFPADEHNLQAVASVLQHTVMPDFR
jgi:hypothetical protein